MSAAGLQLSTPSDTTVVMTRKFNARVGSSGGFHRAAQDAPLGAAGTGTDVDCLRV